MKRDEDKSMIRRYALSLLREANMSGRDRYIGDVDPYSSTEYQPHEDNVRRGTADEASNIASAYVTNIYDVNDLNIRDDIPFNNDDEPIEQIVDRDVIIKIYEDVIYVKTRGTLEGQANSILRYVFSQLDENIELSTIIQDIKNYHSK